MMTPTFSIAARRLVLLICMLLTACTTTMRDTEVLDGYSGKIKTFAVKVDFDRNVTIRIQKMVPKYSGMTVDAFDQARASAAIQRRIGDILRLAVPQLEEQFEAHGLSKNATQPSHTLRLVFKRPLEAFCAGADCAATLDFDLEVVDTQLAKAVWRSAIKVSPPYQPGMFVRAFTPEQPKTSAEAAEMQAVDLANNVISSLKFYRLMPAQPLGAAEQAQIKVRRMAQQAVQQGTQQKAPAPALSALPVSPPSATPVVVNPNLTIRTQVLNAVSPIVKGGLRVRLEPRGKFQMVRSAWPDNLPDSARPAPLVPAGPSPFGTAGQRSFSQPFIDIFDMVKVAVPQLSADLSARGVQVSETAPKFELLAGLQERVDEYCRGTACMSIGKLDLKLIETGTSRIVWTAVVDVYQPNAHRGDRFLLERRKLLAAIVEEMERLALI